MKALGIIDCSFSLDIAKRSAFKPTIGRMLLCLSYKRIKASIRGLDLIFLDLAGGPVQSFSRIVHRHFNCTISLGLSVTAPATKVAGIYGLSTNAMPPQGDYFMASMLAVPDFTCRTSLHNLISGVLRSSLADLPESILLLVARVRRLIVGKTDISRLAVQSESNRYGLCHDYVGGNLDAVEACYDYIGSSLDAVETYPAIEMAGISPAFVLISSVSRYQSIGAECSDISVSNISHKNLAGSSTVLLEKLGINNLFDSEKKLKLVGLDSSLGIDLEPEYDTTIKEMPAFIGQEKNAGSVSNYKASINNKMGLKVKKTDKMISEQIFPCLDIFTGRQNCNNLIKNTIQRIDTISLLRNGIFSRHHSAIGMRSLSYQKYNLPGTHEFTDFSQLDMRDMKTTLKGTVMMPAGEYHTCIMPSLNEGHLIYPTFRKGSDGIQDINAIEKESIETKAERLPSRFQAQPTIDLNRLADQIYSRIQRLTKLERERRGI